MLLPYTINKARELASTVTRYNDAATDFSGGQTTDASSNVGIKLRSYRTFSTTGAKIVSFQNNTSEVAYIDKDGGILATNATYSGANSSATYLTATNCSDSAGAAACGSASAGSVVIDAGATTVIVSTSAVTANSQIFVQYDSSLSTRLGVTCNATVALPVVTARTAGTSFTVTVPVAPISDPACYSFRILN